MSNPRTTTAISRPCLPNCDGALAALSPREGSGGARLAHPIWCFCLPVIASSAEGSAASGLGPGAGPLVDRWARALQDRAGRWRGWRSMLTGPS